MSSPPPGRGRYWRGRKRTLWLGLLLILLGIYYLLNNLGLLPRLQWNIIWPALLILLGLWIIFQRRPA
jgi:hypothetical protein